MGRGVNMTISEQIIELEEDLEKAEEEFCGAIYHPELQGFVVTKYVKCGRPLCSCIEKDGRHGPYYYVQTKNKGKITLTYLSRKKSKDVVPKYEENRRYKKLRAKINRLKREIAHLKAAERRGHDEA